VNGAVSIVGVLRDVHGLPKLTVARQPRKRRQRTYSDTEVAAFLAWHRDRGDREMTAFLTVLAGTGFRFSEAHELERRDVAPGRLTVRSEVAKSGKARTIPTPPAVAEAIADRLQAVGGGLRDRVWSLSKTEIHDRWTAMRAALGLAGDPEAVLHTFRHTVATKLVAAYGIGVAQVWLGHASITTTAGYSHVDVRHLEAAVCAVSVPAPSASLTAALRPPVPALCHLEGAEVVSKAETDEGLAVQPAGARDVPEQKLHLVGQDEKQNVT
jgi:integrase